MKTSALIVLLALGIVARLAAADAPKTDAPPTDAVVIEHGTVDNAFSKGLPMMINTAFKIQAGRRLSDTVNKVEVHDHDTDILWVTEGSATLVTGGQAIGMKSSGPGESRGEKIEGGVTRKVVKGDLIVIPQGVPHWFSSVDGTFLYFVVKVTK